MIQSVYDLLMQTGTEGPQSLICWNVILSYPLVLEFVTGKVNVKTINAINDYKIGVHAGW